MKYQLSESYPQVIIEKSNLKDALLISNSYAGKVSESTAIHLYLYQSFSLKNEYPKYSNILEKIAIVEMHHLELLANVINLLGLKPAYVSYQNNTLIPWTSSYVNYQTQLRDMVKIDLDSELEAISEYNRLIKKIENTSIQRLLKRIIEDEELHVKIFEEILQEIQ